METQFHPSTQTELFRGNCSGQVEPVERISKIENTQHHFFTIAANESEDFAVGGLDKIDRPAPENRMPLAEMDHFPDPGDETAISGNQRESLKALLTERDDLITLLARGDPVAADRLSTLHVAYRQTMSGVQPQNDG